MAQKKPKKKEVAVIPKQSFKCGSCGRVVVNPKQELKCPYCEND